MRFEKDVVRFVMTQLQVGEEAPLYRISLRKPDEFYLAPRVFEVPEGGTISIEVGGSREFGCRTATVVIEDIYGLKSPEYGSAKHYMKSEEINDTQWNNHQRYFSQLFSPETWIQICLGYGDVPIPVLTGAIDMCEIDAGSSKMTLQIRDNMRYLVDQFIDSLKHGAGLTYPRNDRVIVTSDGTKVPQSVTTCVKVKNVKSYLNVRTGPGTNFQAIGKAYNGQMYQWVSTQNGWHEIVFAGEHRWISGAYSDVIYSNQTIASGSVLRVDKIKNTAGNHLHVRSGPGTSYSEIGELDYNQTITCMSKQGDWFQIQWNGGTGWVYSAYCSVDESAGLAGSNPLGYITDYHTHLHVLSQPDNASPEVGLIYDGNTYKYLESQLVGSMYWHKIEFTGPDGVRQGWIDDDASSLEQEASILSYHTIAKVINVSTHLHIRSGPSTNYGVLGEVPNGTLLSYLGSALGDDKKTTWHHVIFRGRLGAQEGWACGTYIQILAGTNPATPDNPDSTSLDPNVMLDATTSVDPTTNKWTAAAIIHDLCAEALHIYGGNGVPFNLDRVIAAVLTEEYNITENEQMSKYVVNQITFKNDQSYFDSAMQIVNQLGDVTFKANRYGDIELYRKKIKDQSSDPDWVVHDFVDMTRADLRYNIQDIRNRVIITSDNGSSLFEHKGITAMMTKGVDRTMKMEVPWADTPEKRHVAATRVFEQMFANWRKMNIAVIGNPLIDVDDVIRVDEMVTTSTSLFTVLDYKHVFNDQGFITELSLEWTAKIFQDEVSLVSEDLPAYSKIFTYNLALNGSPRAIHIKLPATIVKVRIYISAKHGGVLGVIDITGDTYVSGTYDGSAAPTIKVITLTRDGVNLREAADLNSKIRRVERAGFQMQYTGTDGSFYKGIDPDTGTEAYLWSAFCSLADKTGTNDRTQIAPTASSNAVQTFLSIVESKVGCGYVWGGTGQVLTNAGLNSLEKTFGYSHYHSKSYDASHWIGNQVFDCSGLVCWALWQMKLLSTSERYSAQSLLSNICYEVNAANAQPGDLFFRQNKSSIYHVGILAPNGQQVEARGTAYGVVMRARSGAERYGRIIKLCNGSSFTVPNPTNVGVNLNYQIRVPSKYTITSSWPNNQTIPQDVANLVSQLSGNLLLYTNDCILYNVGVVSNGGTKNELVLNWAPVPGHNVTNLDLNYEILSYTGAPYTLSKLPAN